jgi:hypothetical protein
VILAEETHLRWLAWGLPQESRIGARVFGAPPQAILRRNDPLGKLCVRLANTLVAEYLQQGGDTKHLVVLQHGGTLDTPGKRWLAFNPTIAHGLGWTLSPVGLFKWVDIEGTTMVESLWWEDGFFEHKPPHFEDEVGYGWVVRATDAGWEELAKVYGTRTTCVRIDREAGEQSPQDAIFLSTDETKGD